MEFASSARSSVGIEWELAVVDPTSGELVPRAADLLREIGDERFDKEFLAAMIELISTPHESVDAAVRELGQMRDLALDAADRAGLALIGAGTHPSANWRDVAVADDVRYTKVIDRSLEWGRRLVIFGVHTHIGIENRAKVVPIMRYALDFLPLVLALSASSPLWGGRDTGFASHRTMLFQQLPTGGLPPVFADWDDYRRASDEMLRAGVIEELGDLRWDVRPSPALGTVEVRVADGATSLEEVAGVTALTHCLVEEASRAIDAGNPPAHLPAWLVRENKWRAARYGLDAEVIIDSSGTTRGARDVLGETIERLGGLARETGASESLAAAARVLGSGGSAARQRADFARGGTQAVLQGLLDELRR